MEQRTQDWHRARLGCFTASEVGKLIGSPKAKAVSQTAMSLIYKKLGERLLSPDLIADEERFGEFLYRNEVRSKAIEYGNRTEAEAISYYSALTGSDVQEGGYWRHKQVVCFGASPDGLVGEDGLLEVKCPQLEAFARYYALIRSSADLKAVNSDYYWQVQAQLACTGRKWCDWLAYSPDCGNRIVLVRVERDEDDISRIVAAVTNANDIIEEILNGHN